ncbi:MAG: Uma2 family endonuclease [Chloracidobacterium sp.]|uniref:Uma2 family endonuclease n=1 Tax=Chloracidobacterium validum TaxID=2821543 RepID=A0ABX8B9B2_9BACT|nr:Uma2 family endonuclease [Chloracidobacterium validum]QUW03521.1 Uma2 family endonuclease [Chloracidobacterium validum]
MPTSSTLLSAAPKLPKLARERDNPFSEYDEGVYYPAEDGEPMSNSDLHAIYIMQTRSNLEVLFPNDFVGSDILWYPVKGKPRICHAPDVLVAFGRPPSVRGFRRQSYLQWKEDNIPPQVVFEFWSISNKPDEEARKFDFYERYGVEEYYAYDVPTGDLQGWQRQGKTLVAIDDMDGWRSPRLGISFRMVNGELRLFYPDGTPFQSLAEVRAAAEQERAAKERERAAKERERAAKERERAAKEAALAEVERLKEKLRALGLEP